MKRKAEKRSLNILIVKFGNDRNKNGVFNYVGVNWQTAFPA